MVTEIILNGWSLNHHHRRSSDLFVRGCARTPYKQTCDASVHRDIKAHNASLLTSIFDASANYLYCAACIVTVLRV